MAFELTSEFEPAGDQPKAIKALTEGIKKGKRHQTLLGVTGSGKTYTAANVIAHVGKPTLVIAHNKTLAAQLAQEYRDFFPNNAVHYFVSYYDYYQPEAYVPVTDTYIEKEAMINEEIDRLRHASTQALLTRKDVIIVASVSCIYGLGSPAEYESVHLKIAKGATYSRADMIRELVRIYFERTTADLTPGSFRGIGSSLEIMPVNEKIVYRIDLQNDTVNSITLIDPVSRVVKSEEDSLFIFPAKHFVSNADDRKRAIASIEAELKEHLPKLEKEGKILEVERLKRRTKYDLALIREVGYTSGIENYSRHFDGRKPGEAPYTLLDYFPKKPDGSADFLTIIDESHVTVPQIGGMVAGDRSRKQTLIEHGFRLPSAADNRPLTFDEFNERVGQIVYTSATPSAYELEQSGKDGVAEQIIRPTGLIDPIIEIKPIQSSFAPSSQKSSERQGKATEDRSKGEYGGQIKDFIEQTEATIKKGMRVIATTLTKRMAEDLTEYLKEKGIKAEYLHSDIKTIERIEILTLFRKGPKHGGFDVLVGVNLLREGLDLPEVELIGILDADKEGFLRSETSLIQTIGRAARNIAGRVILYADVVTGSIERAVGETNRRRAIQIAYNKEHGITPVTIHKKISDITDQLMREHDKAVHTLVSLDVAGGTDLKRLIREREKAMSEAVKVLDFETAAIIRDEITQLEEMIGEKKVKKTRKK
ncbi:MAG: excinuclease ABC subunit UvrB [Patescibacteria group bacterium]